MMLAFTSENSVYDFGKTVVLSSAHIAGKPTSLSFSLDKQRFFPEDIRLEGDTLDLKNLVCRYLRIEGDCKALGFEEGEGYIGEPASDWDDLFVTKQGWMGGDGLFTYNLYNNRDRDSKETCTLCVFGDTFVNTRGADDSRLDPWLMPHNSYAIIEGAKPNKENISFFVKQGQKGNYLSYLEPDNPEGQEGTMAYNLVNYVRPCSPYLSSYSPKEPVELSFSFFGSYFIDRIRVENYYHDDPKGLGYANRGVKNVAVYGLAEQGYVLIKKITLDKAKAAGDAQTIEINGTYKGIRLVVPNVINEGNYGGINGDEALFGLNKIYFESEGRDLLDIKVDSNSELSVNSKHGWFWLQDGILLDGRFFSLPLVGVSDLSKPEGFQFSIEGVSLLSLPVKEGMPDFDEVRQRSTNLYQEYDGKNLTYGAGILDNRKEDGYIYVYGYISDPSCASGKGMTVARTKEFDNINEYEFYGGNGFVKDIRKAKPVLYHVSCELSVFKDLGRYIAIFTYDVQSPYVAYALSPTPYGPFTPIRIAYAAPSKLCPHQYDYNAKGHNHLSREGDILVSYNVNTSNLEENLSVASTYGPRFIRLKYRKGER